jgi:hypothetical protein
MEQARRRAFEAVMRANAEQTGALYRDPSARALFRALARRFRDGCEARDRTPLLVVIPQPMDLERLDRGEDDYRAFIALLGNLLPVVDLTDAFHGSENWRDLFVDGPLGPHVNPRGNRMIADALTETVGRLLESAAPLRRRATA